MIRNFITEINSISIFSYNTKIDTIFIYSENSKTSDPYRLALNLTSKINLKSNDKYVALSSRSIYDTWKKIKSQLKT